MIQRAISAGRASAGLLALAVALSAGSAAADGAFIKPRLIVWGFTSGTALNQPRGAAFDPRDGALYVANSGAHSIEVFAKAGRPLARFIHRVTGHDGTIVDGTPCTLAFDQAGHLLVVDLMAGYVDVLDRRGRPVTRLMVAGGQPNAVAVAPDGSILVGTAAEASKVYRFSRSYAPLGSWGEPGTAPGSLFNVTALAVMADGTVAVACARTDLAVQLFTPEGVYQRGFGVHDIGDGNFSLPSGLVITADGRIWVADEIRETVQVFDAQGKFLGKTGDSGPAPGEFTHPSSMTSDGRGLIAVTDREIGRAQVFAVLEP